MITWIAFHSVLTKPIFTTTSRDLSIVLERAAKYLLSRKPKIWKLLNHKYLRKIEVCIHMLIRKDWDSNTYEEKTHTMYSKTLNFLSRGWQLHFNQMYR